MTERQAQRSSPAPSVASIVYLGVWTLMTYLVAVWILVGAVTDREFAGGLTSLVFGTLLMGQCVARMSRRNEAVTARRREELKRQTAERGPTVQDGVRSAAARLAALSIPPSRRLLLPRSGDFFQASGETYSGERHTVEMGSTAFGDAEPPGMNKPGPY